MKWATDKTAPDFRERLRQFTDAVFTTGRAVAPAVASATPASTFDEVSAFCMFVGYPADGAFLESESLLDAHPEMVIAHELHVADWVAAGTERHELFAMLLRNSTAYARIGRYWNDHAYDIDGQWQGSYTQLRVIGDKKGAPTTLALMRDPALFATCSGRRRCAVERSFTRSEIRTTRLRRECAATA